MRHDVRLKLGTLCAISWLRHGIRAWNLNDLFVDDDDATFPLIFLLFGQSESLAFLRNEQREKEPKIAQQFPWVSF